MSSKITPVSHPELGGITTVAAEMESFAATDLAEVLAGGSPENLVQPDIDSDHAARLTGQWGGLVLRWNEGYGIMPHTMDEMVPYLVSAERHYRRLAAPGLAVLPRNIYAVPHDRHYGGETVAYTVVPFHGDGKTLEDLRRSDPYNPAFLTTYRGHARYLARIPLGGRFLQDKVGDHQHATDGTLYDYDMYLGRHSNCPRGDTELLRIQVDRLPYIPWQKRLSRQLVALANRTPHHRLCHTVCRDMVYGAKSMVCRMKYILTANNKPFEPAIYKIRTGQCT